jgi:hypothetical protein
MKPINLKKSKISSQNDNGKLLKKTIAPTFFVTDQNYLGSRSKNHDYSKTSYSLEFFFEYF